jgi:pyruvate/2-oxoglutarate dehydrogenase complex dihydrolipoamide dehydrogenase (E3) component
VIGGGYIGVEMAENLQKLGLKATIEVMPLFDCEVLKRKLF